MHIVQAINVVLDGKDAIGSINGFRVCVVVSGQCEANGAHEHICFAASGGNAGERHCNC